MIRQIYDHIALFLTFLAHCSYIPNDIHSIYLVYNFNSDLKFSTGLVAQSVARLTSNWLVREVPGSIPAAAGEGSLQKLGEFFLYK